MIKPTEAQLEAANKAARATIENYSEFDSSMIPDGALSTVVNEALTAALNVPSPTPTTEGPS